MKKRVHRCFIGRFLKRWYQPELEVSDEMPDDGRGALATYRHHRSITPHIRLALWRLRGDRESHRKFATTALKVVLGSTQRERDTFDTFTFAKCSVVTSWEGP